MMTYTAGATNASVKIFLCYASVGTYRVQVINDQSIVDMATKTQQYCPSVCHSKNFVEADKFYSIVLSAFDMTTKMGGVLDVETNWPMLLKYLPPEGHGMACERFGASFT